MYILKVQSLEAFVTFMVFEMNHTQLKIGTELKLKYDHFKLFNRGLLHIRRSKNLTPDYFE